MQIQYDKEADALYITLGSNTAQRGVVSRTERNSNSPVVLDYDQDEKLFGIEVFDVSASTKSGFTEDFLLNYANSIQHAKT